MLDITQGIINASLENCDIANFHNHFIVNFSYRGALDGMYTPTLANDNLVRNYVANTVGFRADGTILQFDDSKMIYQDDYLYDEHQLVRKSPIPLVCYQVDNPHEPNKHGANGVVINLRHGRTLITSGCLGGCTFAVLFRNHNTYIIHVGYSGKSNIQNVQLYNNANVFSMASYLDMQGIEMNIRVMTVNELIYMLETFGFNGYVFYKSNVDSRSVGESKKVVAQSYSTNLQEADVVCVINENDDLEIALRQIITTPSEKKVKGATIYKQKI